MPIKLKSRISVVVPAYNEENYLPACLASLQKQQFNGEYEIIVVDNNSSDKTAQIAEQAGVKVVFEPRQGVGAARQAGCAISLGEVIAFTDADTIVPENWLSRIVSEFEKDKNLAAFGGLYTLSSSSFFTRLAVSFLAYPAHCLDKIFSGGWNLPGANLAVRKTCFLKTGGFNINFQINEEYDICQRIREFGKVKLAPFFLVKTSGRGYEYGFISWFFRYGPATFSRIVFKKHNFNKLKMVRKENCFCQIILEPLLIGLAILFIFVSSPSVSVEAKEGLTFVHKKIISADQQIRAGGQKFKAVIINGAEKLRRKQY